MIIEITTSAGDRAEADTPEGALAAARTLAREAREARPLQGHDPRVRFAIGGRTIIASSEREIARDPGTTLLWLAAHAADGGS